MKHLFLFFVISCVTFTAQAQSFGNYVFKDDSDESRRAAINALIDASNRIEQNNYRTYEDLYIIKHPEQCTFESYTESTPNGDNTYYLVTIPELGITVDCKYTSFKRKRVYCVRLIRNGNGKVVKYEIAE